MRRNFDVILLVQIANSVPSLNGEVLIDFFLFVKFRLFICNSLTKICSATIDCTTEKHQQQFHHIKIRSKYVGHTHIHRWVHTLR